MFSLSLTVGYILLSRSLIKKNSKLLYLPTAEVCLEAYDTTWWSGGSYCWATQGSELEVTALFWFSSFSKHCKFTHGHKEFLIAFFGLNNVHPNICTPSMTNEYKYTRRKWNQVHYHL